MYPTKMEANGHIYSINTDYRIALACFEAMYDENINDIERFYAVESLLLGTDVLFEDEPILKKKIELYLRCGKDENTSNSERDMDYFQDLHRIKISIKQEFNGLDIFTIDYLHWYEFNELIEGLTENSLLDRVRKLRTYDLNKIEDQNERQKLAEAKEGVALKLKVHMTDSQKKSAEAFLKCAGIVR